ncbi:MAG: carboxypeptidase-like regulatory domain-containing protein [Planctomycetota bacterium]|nr:carboxypeptidase-like regulatory domain-containing protein [Planctomycetota bacterium]
MKQVSLQKTTLLVFPILSVFALLSLIVMPVLGDEDDGKNKSKLSQDHRLSQIRLERSSRQHNAVPQSPMLASGKKGDRVALAEKSKKDQAAAALEAEAQRNQRHLKKSKNAHRSQGNGSQNKGSRPIQVSQSTAKKLSKRNGSDLSVALNSSTNVLSVESDAETNASAEDEDEDEEKDDDTPTLGPTIETPVTGKVMSRQSRKGLANVSVTILVFHPLSKVSASPVWIVPFSATTDKNGVFSTTLAIPETPVPGAALGLSYSHSSHSDLAGVPITQLFPGHQQNLGIFWMSNNQSTLQGSITPAFLAENAKLVDTGGLNPLAWDSRIRNDILSLFPIYPINQDEYSISFTKQDSSHNNQRWVTLFSKGAWIGSQSVTWKTVDVDQNGQLKKETIGFADFTVGPDNSLRGSVNAQNGGALSGAVITALTNGNEPNQTAITGANGDFRFAKAPLSLRGFQVSHNDYLTQEFSYAKSGQSPVLVLQNRRPKIPLLLTNSLSGEPIQNVKVTLKSTATPGQTVQQSVVDLQAPTGLYQLTAAFPIGQIIFEREGYFAKILNQPENYPSTAIETTMIEARIIHLTAREAVNKSDRWSEIHESSLVTNWAQKWLEFEIDYGDEATAFDFEIGVRNNGLIDHKYKFDIRVDIPGEASQRVKILASQTDTLTARIVLSPKVGVQKIRMTWLNDRWIPKQLDANILVDWVKFHQRPLTAAEQAQVAANNPQ